MNAINASVVTKVKEVYELNIGDIVPVQLGNPGDASFQPTAMLTVTRIHRTSSGWSFLAEGVSEKHNSPRLCMCMKSWYKEEATAPYFTLNARVIGTMGGRTRAEALASLGFSPD